jgi:hypothetical protein
MAKKELNLNAPPATNLLFSKPATPKTVAPKPAAKAKQPSVVVEKAVEKTVVAESEVKKAARSEVKDLQTTIYISPDDYATIKGLVALKRREGDPFYNLRNAFADIAKMLVAQHPQLEPYHGKLK